MHLSPEERAIEEDRRKHRMESEYKSISPPGIQMDADQRMADASEYIAFQLGQINRKMDTLIAAIEKLTASK